jgi:uracil-DNA glycosylase
MDHITQQEEEKQRRYLDLVRRRKNCRLCSGLTNPSVVCGGRYDQDHIGPWSCWQGNLNSPIVVIAQDWGNPQIFEESGGLEPFCPETDKNTNGMLVDLLGGIGIRIERPKGRETVGKLFFTNAILCLKPGAAQAPVKEEWFEACGREFIKPVLETLNPTAVITLGERAYRAIERSFCFKGGEFRGVVDQPEGIPLFGNTWLFPMYHCGRRILNTHRKIDQQRADWARVGVFLRENRIRVD